MFTYFMYLDPIGYTLGSRPAKPSTVFIYEPNTVFIYEPLFTMTFALTRAPRAADQALASGHSQWPQPARHRHKD